MSGPLPRINGRVQPADPSKPFDRTRRRILLYLSRGGRLRKQPCRDKKDHKRMASDLERYYWILEPMPEIVWRGNLVRERRVSRPIIKSLQDAGFLEQRFREPDEITRSDLQSLPAVLDILARTDWNGNWIKPGLSAIVEKARREGHVATMAEGRRR